MEKSEYETYDDNYNNIEVTTCDYDIPFYRYTKSTRTNPVTGKVEVNKRFYKKTIEEIVADTMIITAGATAINLVTNGISHLIYSVKKKKNK